MTLKIFTLLNESSIDAETNLVHYILAMCSAFSNFRTTFMLVF